MVANFALKLCLLLGFFLTDKQFACGEERGEDFAVLHDFQAQQLIGPPVSHKLIYELTDEYKTGELNVLEVGKLEQTYEVCIKFDYYVNVPDTGRWGFHFVQVEPSGANYTIFSRYGYTGDVWRTEYLDVHVKKGSKFEVWAQTVSGSIAFTPIIYAPREKCETADYTADFETIHTNWGADHDIVVAGEVFPGNRDHTSNSVNGKLAVLKYESHHPVSMYDTKPVKCLSFWYKHASLTADKQKPTHLKVFVSEHLNEQVVWTSRDNKVIQKDTWIQARIPLDSKHIITRHISIDIDGKDKYAGTAAFVDDIEMSESECPEPVSCVFSTDTCDWVDASNGTGVSWDLGRGRAIGQAYLNNHLEVPTTENYTLYVDFSSHTPENPVEIRSGFLPGKDEYCAKIDILYSGIQVADSFKLVQIIHGKHADFYDRSDLWELDTNAAHMAAKGGYKGNTFKVQIPYSEEPRQLAFSAKSSSQISRMAVKEIKLTKGKC